jgi:uncharacterized protein
MTIESQSTQDAVLLSIFIGEDDKFGSRPLYETIVLKARAMRMAGATVIRSPMGYGKSRLLHTTKILRLSEHLPLVIEIVDNEEKINAFLPALTDMMKGGLATLAKIKVMRFGLKVAAKQE